MKARFRIVLAAIVISCAGCTSPRGIFRPAHSVESEYKQILDLYMAGKISLMELTSHQNAIAAREAYERAHPPPPATPTPDPFPERDTTDDKHTEACKRQDPRHSSPHCPPPPGRR